MKRLVFQISLMAVLGVAGSAQTRYAADVLADMRRALGGDAALDAVRTLSVSGSVSESRGQISKNFGVELFTLLPDRFMEVKRDTSQMGPMALDITYYNGFRGDELIRRTDANIPFPPEPGLQTPDAIAQRIRTGVQKHKRSFARLFIALFGKAPDAYPLQFTYAGTEVMEKQTTEVLEATAADGFALRVFVDKATHLPVAVTWQSPPDVVITTTSTATMRGGQVMSQTPPVPLPSGDPTAGLPLVTRRLLFSDFKQQDGFNWPHRVREMVDTKVTEDLRLGKFKINPKLDPRRFDIK